MINISYAHVYNLYGAILASRNAFESWDLSDSEPLDLAIKNDCCNIFNSIILGEKDKKLIQSLIKAGTSHRKFLRQIFVCFDLNAPLYFMKQFDTFKVGVTRNSTSTMHTLLKNELTRNDFSLDDPMFDSDIQLNNTINYINSLINNYKNDKLKLSANEKKRIFKNIIQLLPDGFMQLSTITANYENLLNMYLTRKNHKLDEWKDFCDFVKNLPLFDVILEAIDEESENDN